VSESRCYNSLDICLANRASWEGESMSGIKDKLIVITGAGSGIDEATALLLV
jgi:hypothetical protein